MNWLKKLFRRDTRPTLKPECESSSVCVAMACREKGFDVRVVCKETEPYKNHAQAQIFINGKWTWIRLRCIDFDYIEEYEGEPIVQTWELDEFYQNWKKRYLK